LDGEMGAVYKRLIASVGAGAQDVRASQRKWVTAVRDRCADMGCLIEAYETRIFQGRTGLSRLGVNDEDIATFMDVEKPYRRDTAAPPHPVATPVAAAPTVALQPVPGRANAATVAVPVSTRGAIGAPFDEIHALFCKNQRTPLNLTETIRLNELTMEQQRLTRVAMDRNDMNGMQKLVIQGAKALDLGTCT
jgi:hypothetical protein